MLVTGRPLIVSGDGHRTAGTGVSRDGDRAVIGRVSELGLHHGGQRQQQAAATTCPFVRPDVGLVVSTTISLRLFLHS